MTLKEWYAEYERLAKGKCVEWICTGDANDYRDVYKYASPEDHLLEELEIAREDS